MAEAPTIPKFQLKRSLLIYTLAVAFLVSPFINLASALKMGGHLQWYNPAIWYELFEQVSLMEKLILIGIAISGCGLFLQRKWSWSASVFILILISVYNLFLADSEGSSFAGVRGLNFFVNSSILLVFYFFRFPYLDKRDHIFSGYARRFIVNLPVQVDGADCIMMNISKSGCFLQATEAKDRFQKDQEIKIHFPEGDVQAKVLRIVDFGVGCQFVHMNSEQRGLIKRFIKKFSQP